MSSYEQKLKQLERKIDKEMDSQDMFLRTPDYVKTVGFNSQTSSQSPSNTSNNNKQKRSKEERKAFYQKSQENKNKQREQSQIQTQGIDIPKSNATPPSSRNSSTPKESSSLPSTSPSGKSKPQPQPSKTEGSSSQEKEKKNQPKVVPAVKQFDVKGGSSAKRGSSLFGHLPRYETGSSSRLNVGFSSTGEIHSAILEFGLKIASGEIIGSNARCVGMLLAFKKVISDFHSPDDSLYRDFDIKPLVQFLVNCRPLSISMGNAINYLKVVISETKKMNSSEAKNYLIEMIDKFINERVLIADEAISSAAESKISDGDVILTYSRSHVVELSFKKAHDKGKKFKIILVDSKPKKEGKQLLKRLVKYGINCTYVLISALSYVMKEVSKVFVGAYTMMANGNLLSRVGTALTAMVANSYHVPFIVCCETYKFTERIQLESISFNELGNPEELQEGSGEQKTLKNWKDLPNLTLLNLIYDLTPTEFIAMVITEVGTVPPTSVPVIIREFFKYESH